MKKNKPLKFPAVTIVKDSLDQGAMYFDSKLLYSMKPKPKKHKHEWECHKDINMTLATYRDFKICKKCLKIKR